MQEKETETKSAGMTAQEMADNLAAATEAMAGNLPQAEEGEAAGKSWVAMPQADFEDMIQKAAKAAVREWKRQEEVERRRDKYHNTFTLMKCYRDAVFHIENAVSDGEQLELKGMTEEQQQMYLESIRRTRFKTLIMTAHIDKAVEEIERRRKAAGKEVEYRAFELYFMQGWDYEQIAEELDTGKNTPRRWITKIINELSVLLWGIDEDRVK